MGRITRMLRLCIPLGRQERSARNEGTLISPNLLQQRNMALNYEVATYVEETIVSSDFLKQLSMAVDMALDNNEILRESGLSPGVQKSGLSEETISASLETRIIDIESLKSKDQNEETEICIICQAEYENGEKVGTLNCDHEYHVECIKSWLIRKNACPICKRPAVL